MPDADLSIYALKTDIANLATKADLSGLAQKSDMPSTTGFAKKGDIPDISGLATNDYVASVVATVSASQESSKSSIDTLLSATKNLQDAHDSLESKLKAAIAQLQDKLDSMTGSLNTQMESRVATNPLERLLAEVRTMETPGLINTDKLIAALERSL